MPAGSKGKQRKGQSASGRAQKASAAANRKSLNPDPRFERESTLEARVWRRPGIRADEAEAAAGGFRKGGDFPAGQRPPRVVRRHGKG